MKNTYVSIERKGIPPAADGWNPYKKQNKGIIKYKQAEWWFWAITLVFIIASLAGLTIAYNIVILISAAQIIYFTSRGKSLFAFNTQVRIVYFAYSLSGLWINGRFYFYITLLLGTFMVTALDKCSIAMLLKKMPWNK